MLIFIIVFPKNSETRDLERYNPLTHNHDTERQHYWMMAWPLIILAAITLLLGFSQGLLRLFLTGGHAGLEEIGKHHHPWLPHAALGLVITGILIAWLEFGRSRAGRVGFAERIPALKALFLERWYLDRFYRWLLDAVIYRGVSNLSTKNDNKVIDGSIHAVGKTIVKSGRILSDLHLSMIQYKLMVMFAVVLLLALYFLI